MYKDFDKFFSEMEKKPSLTLKLYDKIYELPTEIPATTMLQTYKMLKEGKDKIGESEQMSIAIQMLGENNVQDWCDRGMSVTQLAEIMKWVATQHSGNNEGTETGKK